MADLGGLFYRNLLFPLLDLRRGTKSLQRYTELKKSQWLSREEIKKLQDQKLKAMIKYAYNKVPFYHRTFKELGLNPEVIKSKDDLCKLPVIDKEIVRKHFDDFKAKDFQRWKPILRTTGGTTGKPLKYYSDRIEHSIFWADLWRVWNWAGYELGDKRATIGGSRPSSSGFRMRSFISSRVMERHLSLSSFEVKSEAMQIHVEKLRKFRPKILRGYPSALYVFANHLEEKQVGDLGIQSVIGISEQLYEHQRKAIENAFGCEIFDNYGCPDGGILACECEKHEYHLNSENAIVEIERDGEVVSPGEEGEIIATNFSKFAMPFIRYKTGDVGRASDAESKCGRGLEILASIQGRTSDYLILPNGNLLSGVNIAALFNALSSQLHIQHYQVVQEKEGELQVLVVEDEGYTEKDSELIKETLQEHIGNEIAIHLRRVDDIPLTGSGKRRSVISKLKGGFG
jgi:phenylacetate-CoA ligase